MVDTKCAASNARQERGAIIFGYLWRGDLVLTTDPAQAPTFAAARQFQTAQQLLDAVRQMRAEGSIRYVTSARLGGGWHFADDFTEALAAQEMAAGEGASHVR